MNLLQKSTLLVSVGLLLSVSYASISQQALLAVPAQNIEQSNSNLEVLPRKTASLDQPGVDKVLGQLRSDSELASTTAKLLKSDPRGVIQRLFRLSTPQAESLKNMSDEELAEMLAPLVKSIEAGNLSKTNVSYTTQPVNSESERVAAPRKTKLTITIGIEPV